MHVNLDYLISLHAKKAILPTFSGQTPHFLGKKQETRTNNLKPNGSSISEHFYFWSIPFLL